MNAAVSIIGCPCHIVHNITNDAHLIIIAYILLLFQVTRFNIEEVVIDLSQGS